MNRHIALAAAAIIMTVSGGAALAQNTPATTTAPMSDNNDGDEGKWGLLGLAGLAGLLGLRRRDHHHDDTNRRP